MKMKTNCIKAEAEKNPKTPVLQVQYKGKNISNPTLHSGTESNFQNSVCSYTYDFRLKFIKNGYDC